MSVVRSLIIVSWCLVWWAACPSPAPPSTPRRGPGAWSVFSRYRRKVVLEHGRRKRLFLYRRSRRVLLLLHLPQGVSCPPLVIEGEYGGTLLPSGAAGGGRSTGDYELGELADTLPHGLSSLTLSLRPSRSGPAEPVEVEVEAAGAVFVDLPRLAEVLAENARLDLEVLALLGEMDRRLDTTRAGRALRAERWLDALEKLEERRRFGWASPRAAAELMDTFFPLRRRVVCFDADALSLERLLGDARRLVKTWSEADVPLASFVRSVCRRGTRLDAAFDGMCSVLADLRRSLALIHGDDLGAGRPWDTRMWLRSCLEASRRAADDCGALESSVTREAADTDAVLRSMERDFPLWRVAYGESFRTYMAARGVPHPGYPSRRDLEALRTWYGAYFSAVRAVARRIRRREEYAEEALNLLLEGGDGGVSER